MIAPVKVQRLRANGSGLSRFDMFEIEREMTLFAPPAQPFPVSSRSALRHSSNEKVSHWPR
jgi:hypothetical protein